MATESDGQGSARARETRAALVELAAQMFAERGYVQTSVRDISRRARLTSGAIYGHFRNKADLLAEAIHARTAEELEARTIDLGVELDYVEALTRLARGYRGRRDLRTLIVQGAAAAATDEGTRERLHDEQRSHLDGWIAAYEEGRDRMGIHPSVDLQAAVLHTWAVELGLGVLEAMGIEPRSVTGWADVQNRMARGLKLSPDDKRRPAPRVRRSTAGAGARRPRRARSR